MAQVTNVPTGLQTDPRAVTIGSVSFSNPDAGITQDQWDLFVAAWGATPKKMLTVDYSGTPPVVSKVSGA